MLSNEAVVRRFIAGRPGAASHLRSDGSSLRSYDMVVADRRVLRARPAGQEVQDEGRDESEVEFAYLRNPLRSVTTVRHVAILHDVLRALGGVPTPVEVEDEEAHQDEEM